MPHTGVSILLSALLVVSAEAGFAQEVAADRTVPEQGGTTQQGSLGVATGGTVREVPYSANEGGDALYQGDILLGPVSRLATIESGVELMSLEEAIIFGLGVRDERMRWPGGIMRFAVNPGIADKSRIYTAIAAWEAATEIRFEEITSPAGNYVEFMPGAGCSSHVGMIGGRQVINMDDSCSTGNTIHEIGHALGLHHEHAREDRGSHVIVHTENILAGREGNFRRDPLSFEDLNAYCHGSIMHYSAYAFSKQPNVLKTIETIPTDVPVGQRSHIAQCDIDAIASLYPDSSVAADATGVGFEGKLELYPANCRQGDKCYLRNDLYFTDKWNVRWKAPARKSAWGENVQSGTTDGASIPKWARWIVGDPYDEEYLLAAVLHDHYCYKENLVRGWRQTHRMFYDGLIALNVPTAKAKIMYSAVYVGGPKWIKLVPGDSCGENCIFDAAFGSGEALKGGDGLFLYRGTRDDEAAHEKFEMLKKVLEIVPDLSLADIESLANSMSEDDSIYRAGESVSPSGADDPIFRQ